MLAMYSSLHKDANGYIECPAFIHRVDDFLPLCCENKAAAETFVVRITSWLFILSLHKMTTEPSIFNSMTGRLLGKSSKESIVKESVEDDAVSDEEEVQQVEPDQVRVFQVTSQDDEERTRSAANDEISVVESNLLERTSSKMTSTESNSNNLQPIFGGQKRQNAADETSLSLAFPSGTILEAAFVDPAYSWPPKDGEGQNAIELQASVALLNEFLDDSSIKTTETMRARMTPPARPNPSAIVEVVAPKAKKGWQCCGKQADTGAVTAVDPMIEYRAQKAAADKARQEHAKIKREKIRQKEKEFRKKNRYNRVPEGILIYRLDTSTQQLSLMSEPHTRTDRTKLIREMRIVQTRPSPDRSRRGLEVVGVDGRVVTLVACEQRTATAWWEAMHLMLAKNRNHNLKVRIGPVKKDIH